MCIRDRCCFTSTETVGLLGTEAQDGHLGFHTVPELCDVENAVTKRHSWPENKILDVWFLWPCVLPVGERPAFLDKEAFRRLVPLDTALMMD